MRGKRRERAGSAGWVWLRVLIALVVVGLVLPRLLGAVTDYLFPSTELGVALDAAEPALSPAIVPERAVYQSWVAALVVWWMSLRRDTE